MTLKDFWRRELWVARHGQPRGFRVKKWLIIIAIAALLWWWKGPLVVLYAFLTCCFLGIGLHFLLRYKTEGWTRDWGPYKRITLDGEK